MNTPHSPAIIKRANQIARAAGYGRATAIEFGRENKIVKRQSPGYRKYSTGEYVAKAYLANFGWKNTYYQHAITIVMLAE